MAQSASSFLQDPYGHGARRIGVLNVPAIGCAPAQRTLSGNKFRDCLEQVNRAARLFNSKFSSLVDSFANKLPEAKLVRLDVYNPSLCLIQNPEKCGNKHHEGFEVVTKGCCGTGTIEVSFLCNPYSMHTCSDASKYIFWDSFHPFVKSCEILTPLVLDDKINNFF